MIFDFSPKDAYNSKITLKGDLHLMLAVVYYIKSTRKK